MLRRKCIGGYLHRFVPGFYPPALPRASEAAIDLAIALDMFIRCIQLMV